MTDRGERRIITWSGTVLRAADGRVEYIIATGNDVTERKRLERALLEISGREQRRIGQDLHDGLGQHLTGTAFMSKVLQQKLEDQALPEAAEASKIVKLVNEAIEKTRELSRGLLPVVSDADGLMSALQRFAGEVEDLFSVSCRFVCDRPVLLGRRGRRHTPVSHRAGGGQQRHQAWPRTNNCDRALGERRNRPPRGRRRRRGHRQSAGQPVRHGLAHHGLPRQHDRRLARRQVRPGRHERHHCRCLFPMQVRE